ncbi:hypothetical protein DQ448_13820 [Salmonella enterica]|nr:hypothetical protein [Salmonella enterica]EBJ4496348.1 hypothetical protein [Salmonella enterica]MFZ35192.1 hypothetical protein [Salmonella enterica]
MPYRRPAERFKPDNDAPVVDETNNKTKSSICKAKSATKSSILGVKIAPKEVLPVWMSSLVLFFEAVN